MEITLVQLFVLLCMVSIVYLGLFGGKKGATGIIATDPTAIPIIHNLALEA